MEYLALYRKYRPKELDEVVGQSEIKKILASSVKNGTISHAYLFSGPRGTGKTTMAKILAKMVNCLDPVDGNACNKCESCLSILNSNDVIEIDAASNNGVDEIRELREKANLIPSNAKYKVYIIDEVHMLTTQAFNALLKTLEEPPKHVIFVLATTEYYKIPLTITSRCQKFQFNKISVDGIVDRLNEIAKLEKIKINDDAVLEIAKISDGGMRDSINFLDQLRSFTSSKITIDDVYEVCGNVSSTEMVNLLGAMRDNDVSVVNDFFENMDKTGKNYGKFLENFVGFLKDIILFDKGVKTSYIKSDIECVKQVESLFSIDEIFYIVDNVNLLMDRLKNVSRQSVVVITNFLLIMNKFANFGNHDLSLKQDKETNDIKETEYDMAFEFTSRDEKDTSNESIGTEELEVENNEDSEQLDGDRTIKNKEIIINNAFAVANKEIKNSLQEKYASLGDYLTDKKYKVAASTLADVKIEVAGEGYIIFSAQNDAVVDKINSNYKLCGDLLIKVFKDKYNFVVLTYEAWNKYKNEYVTNFRSGKKYTLMEFNDDEISTEEVVKKEPTVVDKLFDLVGEEYVEFR